MPAWAGIIEFTFDISASRESDILIIARSGLVFFGTKWQEKILTKVDQALGWLFRWGDKAYSYHIPIFQSHIWISLKAGFWYEMQERRGVLFSLKDGVQFEKNVLLLKDRFYCSKAGFRFRKAGFTLWKAAFLLKGREGCAFHFETRGVFERRGCDNCNKAYPSKILSDFLTKTVGEKDKICIFVIFCMRLYFCYP